MLERDRSAAATYFDIVYVVFHHVRRERTLQLILVGAKEREREKNSGNPRFAQRETNKQK